MEGIDQVDALRSVGDVDRRIEIVHENANDLAEAQRHDRQVVAAKLERRRAEQHAEDAGDAGAERQDHPERQMQAEVRRREQRVDIRTDGIERDVAEVEQSGETDDDIESECQHDVEHREIQDAHPRLAGQRRNERQERERERHQRDADPGLGGIGFGARAGHRAARPARWAPVALMPDPPRARPAVRTGGRSAPGSARRTRTRPDSCCRTWGPGRPERRIAAASSR